MLLGGLSCRSKKMKKLIINLIMVVVITPLILLASYTFAYEVLIIKSEVEEMEEKTVKTFNVNESYPKLLCDGCYQEKVKLTQHVLPDINTKVNLCDDCLEVFTELEKEEQND